jgi:hypothetical protein
MAPVLAPICLYYISGSRGIDAARREQYRSRSWCIAGRNYCVKNTPFSLYRHVILSAMVPYDKRRGTQGARR